MPLSAQPSLHPDHRTLRVSFNGVAAWQKFALVRSRPVYRALAATFAACSGQAVFASSYFTNGRAALAFEAARMQQLHRQGFYVPEILSSADDWSWITMSDMGDALQTTLDRTRRARMRRRIMTWAMHAMLDLHSEGQYHGRPNFRDLTCDRDGRIGFIDLEHNPLRVMTLHEAQARDIAQFLLSASRYAYADRRLVGDLLKIYQRAAPEQALRALSSMAHTMKPALDAAATMARLVGKGGSVARAVDTISVVTSTLPYRPPAKRGAVRITAQPG